MKKIMMFFSVGAIFAAGACSRGGGVALRDGEDSLSYIIGMNVARNLLQMDSTLRPEAVCRGIEDVFRDRMLLGEDEARTYYLRYITYELPEKVRAYEERFLEDIRQTSRSYARTTSGLTYTVEAIGDERQTPSAQRDTVFYRYIVRTVDGKQLYSSYDKGDTIRMPLREMLQGLQESVKLIGKGGKIGAWLPAATAYGAEGNAELGIGPNATLFFEVELVDLRKESMRKSVSEFNF